MYDIHPPCKLTTEDLATMWIDSGGRRCSGACLGNNIVITAGHCVVANNKFTIDTLQYEPALEPDVQSFRPIEVMNFVSKTKPYNKTLSDKNPITRFRTHGMLFGDINKRDYTNVGDSGSILADGIEKIHPKWYNYNNTNQNPNFEDTCNYAAIQSSIAQEFIR